MLTVEQSLMLGLPVEPEAIPEEAKAKCLATDDAGDPITEADIMMEFNLPPEDWMPVIASLPPADFKGDPEDWGWIEQVRARRRSGK